MTTCCNRAKRSHSLLARWAFAAIQYYRRTGGGKQWFGIDCNFTPTCSAFTRRAIVRFGFWRGVRLGWNRIRRCQMRDSVCYCLEPLPRSWDDAQRASR